MFSGIMRICDRCEESPGVVQCRQCHTDTEDETVYCEECAHIVHIGRLTHHKVTTLVMKEKHVATKKKLADYQQQCSAIESKVTEIDWLKGDLKEMERVHERNIRHAIVSLQQQLKEKGVGLVHELRAVFESKVNQLSDIQNQLQKGIETCEAFGQEIKSITEKNEYEFAAEVHKDDCIINKEWTAFDFNVRLPDDLQFHLDLTSVKSEITDLTLNLSPSNIANDFKLGPLEIKQGLVSEVYVTSHMSRLGVFTVLPKLSDASLVMLQNLSSLIRSQFICDKDWLLASKLDRSMEKGERVYVRFSDSKWYRGVVQERKALGSKFGGVSVKFFDYGIEDEFPLDRVLPVRPQEPEWNKQAVECCLFPKLDKYVIGESKWMFHEEVNAVELKATFKGKVLPKDEDSGETPDIWHVELCTFDGVSINEMISKKMAEDTTRPQITCRDIRYLDKDLTDSGTAPRSTPPRQNHSTPPRPASSAQATPPRPQATNPATAPRPASKAVSATSSQPPTPESQNIKSQVIKAEKADAADTGVLEIDASILPDMVNASGEVKTETVETPSELHMKQEPQETPMTDVSHQECETENPRLTRNLGDDVVAKETSSPSPLNGAYEPQTVEESSASSNEPPLVAVKDINNKHIAQDQVDGKQTQFEENSVATANGSVENLIPSAVTSVTVPYTEVNQDYSHEEEPGLTQPSQPAGPLLESGETCSDTSQQYDQNTVTIDMLTDEPGSLDDVEASERITGKGEMAPTECVLEPQHCQPHADREEVPCLSDTTQDEDSGQAAGPAGAVLSQPDSSDHDAQPDRNSYTAQLEGCEDTALPDGHHHTTLEQSDVIDHPQSSAYTTHIEHPYGIIQHDGSDPSTRVEPPSSTAKPEELGYATHSEHSSYTTHSECSDFTTQPECANHTSQPEPYYPLTEQPIDPVSPQTTEINSEVLWEVGVSGDERAHIDTIDGPVCQVTPDRGPESVNGPVSPVPGLGDPAGIQPISVITPSRDPDHSDGVTFDLITPPREYSDGDNSTNSPSQALHVVEISMEDTLSIPECVDGIVGVREGGHVSNSVHKEDSLTGEPKNTADQQIALSSYCFDETPGLVMSSGLGYRSIEENTTIPVPSRVAQDKPEKLIPEPEPSDQNTCTGSGENTPSLGKSLITTLVADLAPYTTDDNRDSVEKEVMPERLYSQDEQMPGETYSGVKGVSAADYMNPPRGRGRQIRGLAGAEDTQESVRKAGGVDPALPASTTPPRSVSPVRGGLPATVPGPPRPSATTAFDKRAGRPTEQKQKSQPTGRGDNSVKVDKPTSRPAPGSAAESFCKQLPQACNYIDAKFRGTVVGELEKDGSFVVKLHHDVHQEQLFRGLCHQLNDVGRLAVCASNPEIGKFYLAREDKVPNIYHRAQLIEKGKRVEVRLVDLGTKIKTSASNLMELPEKFQGIPMQAHRCSIWNINFPLFNEAAINLFKIVTKGKELIITVIDLTKDFAIVSLRDNEKSKHTVESLVYPKCTFNPNDLLAAIAQQHGLEGTLPVSMAMPYLLSQGIMPVQGIMDMPFARPRLVAPDYSVSHQGATEGDVQRRNMLRAPIFHPKSSQMHGVPAQTFTNGQGQIYTNDQGQMFSPNNTPLSGPSSPAHFIMPNVNEPPPLSRQAPPPAAFLHRQGETPAPQSLPQGVTPLVSEAARPTMMEAARPPTTETARPDSAASQSTQGSFDEDAWQEQGGPIVAELHPDLTRKPRPLDAQGDRSDPYRSSGRAHSKRTGYDRQHSDSQSSQEGGQDRGDRYAYRVCYGCNQMGHQIRDCPTNKGGRASDSGGRHSDSGYKDTRGGRGGRRGWRDQRHDHSPKPDQGARAVASTPDIPATEKW